MGQYQTFIVRLWTEETERAVRGHIQHIASRRGAYFRDVERMIEFMRDYLEPASGSGEDLGSPGGERDLGTRS